MAAAQQFSTLYQIDDLIKLCASEADQIPLLGYPRTEYSVDDYVKLTGKGIDAYVDGAVRALVAQGLSLQSEPKVAAVLGPSNFSLLMTICGLSRLGYTVLVFSPRLSPSAYISLLKRTGCQTLVHTPEHNTTVQQIRTGSLDGDDEIFETFAMITTSQLEVETLKDNLVPRQNSSPAILDRVAFIMHSSGSTGMPKPIYHSHRRCIATYNLGVRHPALITLPLFHAYGFSCFYRNLECRNLMYMFNSSLPLTVENVVGILETVKPQMVSTTPYTLKLFAESPRGVEALARCEVVSYHGSACPDDLGDKLTKLGVHIVGHIGSTEAGGVGSTARPRGDDSWNYFRFLPAVVANSIMKPAGSGVYELVLLEGLKTKVLSNSDDPPNSLHTRDLFSPHPTIPNAWKFVGRLDDRVTLVNGEKVLPLPMEGRIRQDPLVKEAVIFGIGRAAPGLLVFRGVSAEDLPNDKYIDSIWPSIRDANEKAEDFSQISRELIILQASDVDYPRTDKGTIIRARVYEAFASEINEIYDRMENATQGSLRLDALELERFILQYSTENLGIGLRSVHDDFYTAGLDSLRAMQLASYLKRNVFLNGNSKLLNQNSIYENGNVTYLAHFLYRLQTEIPKDGQMFSAGMSDLAIMADLIKKYSRYSKPRISEQPTSFRRSAVILTGATGTLGAHLLAQLLALPHISKVFCLVRRNDANNALQRVQRASEDKGLPWTCSSEQKVAALESDLSESNLGLSTAVHNEIKDNVHTIIHCAWPVNFNIGIRSFEGHIKGVRNLIDLSLSVSPGPPASFYFCSSVSVASRTPAPAIVPEELISDLTHAQTIGYGQSKLVCEHIIHNARAQGAGAFVLRIGQIIGDSIHGRWNGTEAIPLMIRSAVTLGALPAMKEQCAWFPVDYLAKTILQVAGIDRVQTVDSNNMNAPGFYNLVNPKALDWSADILPALKAAGLSFESVSPTEWLRRLKDSDKDAERNPTIKLVDFYERRYGNIDPDKGRPEIVFATDQAREESRIMRTLPNLVEVGILAKCVRDWQRKWAE